MKKVKLETLCKIASSKRIFEKEYVSNGIPFIRGKEISDGSLLNGDKFECYISKQRFEELKTTYGVPTVGDILITAVGTIGNLCYLNKKIDFYFKDGNIIWFSNFNNDLYSKYLFFFMKSNFFKTQLSNKRIGAVQKAITIDMLKNIELNLPDLPTQTQIAAILSSLDDKIELNNRIASVLERMMREIYDYWFVQFDFPDENGKPYQSNGGKMTYNPQLKRNIPQGWEVKKLGDIFSITMGSSPKGHSLNENGKGIEFYQGSTDFGRLYPTIRVFTTAPVRFAKSQDILMSVRAPVGAMNIAMNDCCIGRGLAAIHHESPLFAWYTMQTFKLYFDTFNGNGTTFGSLTSDNLKEQLTVAPNKSILQMFIKKTQSVGEKLKTITMENIQLTALRDFLLPLLMNGQASVQ